MKDDIINIVAAVITTLLINFIACWLWRIIVAEIFNLPILNYWEIFGLRLLSNCIFKIKALNWGFESDD